MEMVNFILQLPDPLHQSLTKGTQLAHFMEGRKGPSACMLEIS
jgi:hypothetical protein